MLRLQRLCGTSSHGNSSNHRRPSMATLPSSSRPGRQNVTKHARFGLRDPPTMVEWTAVPSTEAQRMARSGRPRIRGGQSRSQGTGHLIGYVAYAGIEDNSLENLTSPRGSWTRLQGHVAWSIRFCEWITSQRMEFQNFLRQHGVEHRLIPPYWPQANSEVERQNRSLLKAPRIAAISESPWQT